MGHSNIREIGKLTTNLASTVERKTRREKNILNVAREG